MTTQQDYNKQNAVQSGLVDDGRNDKDKEDQGKDETYIVDTTVQEDAKEKRESGDSEPIFDEGGSLPSPQVSYLMLAATPASFPPSLGRPPQQVVSPTTAATTGPPPPWPGLPPIPVRRRRTLTVLGPTEALSAVRPPGPLRPSQGPLSARSGRRHHRNPARPPSLACYPPPGLQTARLPLAPHSLGRRPARAEHPPRPRWPPAPRASHHWLSLLPRAVCEPPPSTQARAAREPPTYHRLLHPALDEVPPAPAPHACLGAAKCLRSHERRQWRPLRSLGRRYSMVVPCRLMWGLGETLTGLAFEIRGSRSPDLWGFLYFALFVETLLDQYLLMQRVLQGCYSREEQEIYADVRLQKEFLERGPKIQNRSGFLLLNRIGIIGQAYRLITKEDYGGGIRRMGIGLQLMPFRIGTIFVAYKITLWVLIFPTSPLLLNMCHLFSVALTVSSRTNVAPGSSFAADVGKRE